METLILKDRIEIQHSWHRGQTLVIDSYNEKVLFHIDHLELEDDLDLQNAEDEEVTDYVLEYYSEEILDLIDIHIDKPVWVLTERHIREVVEKDYPLLTADEVQEVMYKAGKGLVLKNYVQEVHDFIDSIAWDKD